MSNRVFVCDAPVTDVQNARVIVGEQGYEPGMVRLRAGVPARITFLRAVANGNGSEVELPALGIRRTLPINEPVVIGFTPSRGRNIEFGCGTKMPRGTIVVAME
jgi:plastocyanin domain-containing protein